MFIAQKGWGPLLFYKQSQPGEAKSLLIGLIFAFLTIRPSGQTSESVNSLSARHTSTHEGHVGEQRIPRF